MPLPHRLDMHLDVALMSRLRKAALLRKAKTGHKPQSFLIRPEHLKRGEAESARNPWTAASKLPSRLSPRLHKQGTEASALHGTILVHIYIYRIYRAEGG